MKHKQEEQAKMQMIQRGAAFNKEGVCMINTLKISDWDRANEARALVEAKDRQQKH